MHAVRPLRDAVHRPGLGAVGADDQPAGMNRRDLLAWVPGQGETAGVSRVGIARAPAAGLMFRPLATTAADTLAWFAAFRAWHART